VAITPDGAFAYVANPGSDDVSVIATSTNTVVATVTVGQGPFGVAITPDGAFAYVTNGFSDNVSVIATSTNTVVATVTVELFPRGVAITPDGAFAYVTNRDPDNVSVIVTSTNTVVATVSVGDDPIGVAITPVTEPCTLEQLSEAIDALGPHGDGTLNKGQANSLQKKVHKADVRIDQGKIKQATSALEVLIKKVEAFARGGVLDERQANVLIGCAEEIIEGL
jgi:YVTN family beta-propeller protein